MDWMSPPVETFHHETQQELLKHVYLNRNNIASFADFVNEFGNGCSMDLGEGRTYDSAETFANSADAKCLYRCYPGGNSPYLFLTNNPGTPGWRKEIDFERSLHHAFEGDVNHIAGICRVLVVNWFMNQDDSFYELFERLSEIATRGSLANYTDAATYFQKEKADKWKSAVANMDAAEAVEWIHENPRVGPNPDEGFLNDFTYDVAFNLESGSVDDLRKSDREKAKSVTEERIRCIDPEVIIASGRLAWPCIYEAIDENDLECIRGSGFEQNISDAAGGVFQGQIGGKRRTILAVNHPATIAQTPQEDLVERAAKLNVF